MTDDLLLELGGLVESALADALIALDHRDLVLADNVVRGDVEINRVRYQVEACPFVAVESSNLSCQAFLMEIVSMISATDSHSSRVNSSRA